MSKHCVLNTQLQSKDTLTQSIIKKNITTFSQLIKHVKLLSYGRHRNRSDFSLVFKAQKGSCSSKHAFLKTVADLNQINNVKLILCIYKMNAVNTPKIGNALDKFNLNYIPEAHCFLSTNNTFIDVTSANSNINKIKNDIVLTKEILPKDVVEYKVDFHKRHLKKWLEQSHLKLSFSTLWQVREQCIYNLQNASHPRQANT